MRVRQPQLRRSALVSMRRPPSLSSLTYRRGEPYVLMPDDLAHVRQRRSQLAAGVEAERDAGDEDPLEPAAQDRRRSAPPRRVDEDEHLGTLHEPRVLGTSEDRSAAGRCGTPPARPATSPARTRARTGRAT